MNGLVDGLLLMPPTNIALHLHGLFVPNKNYNSKNRFEICYVGVCFACLFLLFLNLSEVLVRKYQLWLYFLWQYSEGNERLIRL